MILNIKTRFKYLGTDGQAIAILDLHYEGNVDDRARLESAIAQAMAPDTEPEEKASQLGFQMDHEDEE